MGRNAKKRRLHSTSSRAIVSGAYVHRRPYTYMRSHRTPSTIVLFRVHEPIAVEQATVAVPLVLRCGKRYATTVSVAFEARGAMRKAM